MSEPLPALDPNPRPVAARHAALTALYDHLDRDDVYEWEWGVRNPVAGAYWRRRDALVFQSVVEHFTCPIASLRVLEVGTGHGHELAKFAQLGIPHTNLFGTDLLQHRLAWAKSIYPAIHFSQQDATNLLFPDRTFDLVCQFSCFEHLREREMQRVASREMVRVLKPGGLIIWWDMAPVSWSAVISRRVHRIWNSPWSARPALLSDGVARTVHEAMAARVRQQACGTGWPPEFLPVSPKNLEEMFAGLEVVARPTGTDYEFWRQHWKRRRAVANWFWTKAWLSTHCFATIVKPGETPLGERPPSTRVA